ncbi:MAG: restriction endonuclease subunit M [Fervidicoccus fontis]|nr:MAG: restriction endonuclease subunit M [Fervidicoccus fontis]
MKARILKKLGIEPVNNESFQIFIASIKTIMEYAGDVESLANWNAPILSDLNKLSSSEIELIKSEVQNTNLSIKECQVEVQKLIPQEKRKKFAVYYTIQQGTDLMTSIVKEFLSSRKEKVVLVDPFLGSGSTLTAAIEKIGVEKVEKVWGIEPLPLPALVAYVSLLHSMNGKRDAVTVILGDAFEEIPKMFSPPFVQSKLPKADIILTNPPFTRWKYLEKKYREHILSVIEKLGYKKYITRKEVSLQTLSMFLCDRILNNNGLLISVLPASTFYTIYGRGYKSLLKEKYGIYAMVESKSRVSFSEDSGFKEIIIVAVKGSNKKLTAFIELKDNVEDIAKIIMSDKPCSAFDLRVLPRFLDINWLVLFGEDKLRDVVVEIFKQGLKKGTLGYWDEMFGRNSIIRGVEMYGPEFFFIPNTYWKILEGKNDSVRIQNKNKELVISKEFLVKTLRKPSLYSHKIEADVDTFMLSIPPVDDLPSDLQEYVEWGVNSGAAKPAINAYGKYWYSHVHKQMTTKKPFGQVFIPDKVDLLFKNRSVFANYTKERVAASKNFYIVRDKNETHAKLFIGWFNSTIFISVLVLLGRRISETWTRFLENDYLELPVINLNINSEEAMSEVVKNVNKMLNKHLPPLWKQLNKDYRYKLDLAIFKFIGIENPERTIEKLYQLLSNLSHGNR